MNTTRKQYILEYYEPGKRTGTIRKARTEVDSIREAEAFLNEKPEERFLPASVMTRGWKPNVVAIIGRVLNRPLA